MKRKKEKKEPKFDIDIFATTPPIKKPLTKKEKKKWEKLDKKAREK